MDFSNPYADDVVMSATVLVVLVCIIIMVLLQIHQGRHYDD